MVRHKLSRHFLPHFVVDSDSVKSIFEPDRVHHRAHALNLTSLFLYLQILLIFGAGLFVVRLKAPQILGTVTFSADQIITLTNQKRAQNGLSAVTYNSTLAAAAAAKAQNMFFENYWAHNSPSGKTPWSFISAAGYHYVFAGENLARDFDDAGSVVDAWMNSPSHRSNLLDKNFKEIGVAVSSGKLTDREGSLVVQMFGTSVSSTVSQIAQVEPAPAVVSASAVPTPSPVEIASSNNDLTRNDKNGSGDLTRNDSNQEVNVLASRQFSIAKGVTLAIIGFIFALFALEVLVTFRREKVPVRSGILAHLLILAFVLLAVWYAVSGAII